MKLTFQLNKNRLNKKGVSLMVSYVLIISITLALSVLVYNWLRFYTGEEELPACPEGVNIIIKDYYCVGGTNLQVTLKNKGRFTIDGFLLRVHNRTGADLGFYTLNDTGVPIAPGEEHITTASLNSEKGYFPSLTLIEVQPFLIEEGRISCKSLATQEISCVSS